LSGRRKDSDDITICLSKGRRPHCHYSDCTIDDDAHICCDIAGENYQNIECRILDNEVRDYNDFDNCDKVVPKEYSAKMTEKGFEIDLPKCSVVVVTMR